MEFSADFIFVCLLFNEIIYQILYSIAWKHFTIVSVEAS